MKELSHYQKRVLDKIYGPLKKTDPLQELKRLCRIHLDFLYNEKDRYIRSEFKKKVEANLIFYLNSDKRFQDYESFKENYLLETKKFLNNLPDELGGWHRPSKLIMAGNAFTNKIIDEQKSILDGSVKVLVPIENEEAVNIMQFVSDVFLEEYRFSSRLKIELLKNELSSLNKMGDKNAKNNLQNSFDLKAIKYDNPYPEYFISYGYEIFKEFTEDFVDGKIVLAPISFLIDQLRKDDLINKDKSLISIFNFLLEEFDMNFGTATKFKSDFSRDKYLLFYNAIKKRYDTIPK